MRAIERAGLAAGLLADGRAMLAAEARGNLLNYPLRALLSSWWTYTAVTREPELRDQLPFFRERARRAVRMYRERGRPVSVERRRAA